MDIGLIHENFNSFLLRVKESILIKKLYISGYSKEQIADRLVQSILTEVQSDFVNFVGTNFQNDSQNIQDKLKQTSFGGIDFLNFYPIKIALVKKIDFSKRILKTLLKEIISLISSFFCDIKLDKLDLKVVSIFPLNSIEDIKKNDSFLPFQEFVCSNFLHGINQSDIFFIKYASEKDFKINNFVYTSDPKKYIFYLTRQSLWREFLFICSVLISSIVLFLRSLRNPLFFFLTEDILQTSFWDRIEKGRFTLNYVINTGNCYSHHLFFRKKRANVVHHMMHYSQNSIPFSFKGDNQLHTFTSMKWMALDIHWVWTNDFKNYLKNECKIDCLINVIGPILWYPNTVRNKKKRREKDLLLFDVTPVRKDLEKTVAIRNNYYSYETVSRFIEDTVEIASDLNIKVSLKSKREIQTKFHDPSYSDILKKLEMDFKNFEIIHHSVDMFKLISDSSLIVAIPFTSVAYVAQELKIPSIYYDPINALECVIPFPKGIKFINNKNELNSAIKNHFSNLKEPYDT